MAPVVDPVSPEPVTVGTSALAGHHLVPTVARGSLDHSPPHVTHPCPWQEPSRHFGVLLALSCYSAGG